MHRPLRDADGLQANLVREHLLRARGQKAPGNQRDVRARLLRVRVRRPALVKTVKTAAWLVVHVRNSPAEQHELVDGGVQDERRRRAAAE